jgi:hypothetical protein
VAGADRLPAWSWNVGGVSAEVGAGRHVVDVGAAVAPQPTPSTDASGGRRGQNGAGGLRAPLDGPPQTNAPPGSRYVFPTYAEAEAFAAKSRAHLLQPQWVPAGFDPEPLAVTLSALTPEQAAIQGRAQRVAATQRFIAAGGLFTIVQSVPPPVFDLMMLSGEASDELVLSNGQHVGYGEYPQGIILYWHERGDTRSVAVIGDPGAAAQLTRADWQHLAESLS